MDYVCTSVCDLSPFGSLRGEDFSVARAWVDSSADRVPWSGWCWHECSLYAAALWGGENSQGISRLRNQRIVPLHHICVLSWFTMSVNFERNNDLTLTLLKLSTSKLYSASYSFLQRSSYIFKSNHLSVLLKGKSSRKWYWNVTLDKTLSYVLFLTSF